MNRWFPRFLLICCFVAALPFRSPAPLIYRPGEGWSYERPGTTGKWQKTRAKDQLDIAKEALEKNDYDLALKSSRRVVKVWPLSDYAPEAQYILGRSYEGKRQDEKAFKAYQTLLEKYPKATNYEEVLKRQHEIAGRFLNGQWFKLWGYIPFFASMEKTAEMYEKIIKNGPYSPLAPEAQINVGVAREKQGEFPAAVKAYERAADRYNDQDKVAADALFKAAQAYHKQAKTAEYDQNAAAQAIATYTDFMTLHPKDPRLDQAKEAIASLKTEQARGSFRVAQFYEKGKRWDGALVYYNEVLVKDPDSQLATEARQRIEELKNRVK